MDTQTRQSLLEAALGVRVRAYAPFSKFQVGAALWTPDGQIFTGVNVENSSYGLTCCAERVAIFAAVAAGQSAYEAIAVASPGGCAPCGACRQVMSEFGPQAMVFLMDVDHPEKVQETTVAELLPLAFRLDQD